jgi:hypothetical protein
VTTLRVPPVVGVTPVEKYCLREMIRGELDSSGSGWDPQRDVVYPGLKIGVL